MSPSAGVPLSDVVLLDRHQSSDDRGVSFRVWPVGGVPDGFVIQQVLVSVNERSKTLRGLHFQLGDAAEDKIVGVLRGSVWDVVVDLREHSPTYRSWAAYEIRATDGVALFVPAGLAHGYLTLEDNTEVVYLIDGAYDPARSSGIMWNDAGLGIEWPDNPEVISGPDTTWPLLREGFSVTS